MKKALISLLIALMCVGGIFAHGADDRIVSTSDFSYVTFTKVEKRATIEFDVNANTVSDGIIGITADNINPSAWGDYAICFRIRKGGFFDANDGSSWGYENNVTYTAGQTYHVVIDADITNQIYNAFVMVDGEKVAVAKNYAFRTNAQSLSKIMARGGSGVAAGLYYIENITFTQGEGQFETLELPNFFMDNMVLQRGEKHVIYGKSNAEKVYVTLTDGKTTSMGEAKTANGKFEVKIDPVPASLEPYKMTVSTKDNQVVIDKVFVGDVFFLAGQSNMAQTYWHQKNEQLGDGVTTSNMPALVDDERIKYVTLSQTASDSESFDVPFLNGTGWQPLNSSTNKNLSYIGMFFAQDRLADEPDVPIGLISVAWRGTAINRWIRKSDDNKSENYTPSSGNIYNNHVAPFVKYPVSAIMWYQGESDSKNYFWYEEAFQTMIKDYRRQWGKDELPFFFVQLARYSKDDYQYQRQSQMKALSLKNTGMAVILDTDKGTQANIHPLGKEEVAERLYLLARKYVYGEDIVAQGPVYESSYIKENEITVSFREDTIGSGLCIKNTYGKTNSELCEFEIAGRDGKFVKANARINSDNTISIWAEGVNNPVCARYAFSRVPENPNLFNKDGLPASPFTTDERMFSAASFFSKHTEEIDNGKVQKAEFVLVPEKDNINGVISFTGRRNRITGWGSCGVTIRFQEDGYFGYIDGSGFITSNIAYSKGKKYRVTIICDFEKKTYSAIINGTVMCEGAAFRDGALGMNNMGRFLVRGGDGSAAREFYAESFPVIEECGDNSFVRAKKDGEEVIFALNLKDNIRIAHFENESLIKVNEVKGEGNVTVAKMPEGDNRIFAWDENIQPKDGSNRLSPVEIEVSAQSQEENKKEHISDGDLATRWAGEGDVQTVTLDYGRKDNISSVAIAFWSPFDRMAYYKIEVSDDKESWETVFDGKSTGQVWEVRKVDKDARFVRLTGRGTSANEKWLSINEIMAFN